MSDHFDCERLTASAARFLIDGGEENAANVLLACTLNVWYSGDGWWSGDERLDGVHVELAGPRIAYDFLQTDMENPIATQIRKAIEAVLPTQAYIRHFSPKAELVDISPDWRSDLSEIARGRQINNQAPAYGNAPPSITWNNLKFRSVSERRIAEALDAAGVLFFPNCVARLGENSVRRNREPDFLVCHSHKWGILEVDGEPFHPPSRTTQDHERDRLFRSYGIRVVEHYDASRCYQDPAGVVKEFLELMDRNG